MIAYAPHRISYFGGGTDFEEFYRNGREGVIISVAIDRYSRITTNGQQSMIESDVPTGSGLGGSGALMVNWVNLHDRLNDSTRYNPELLAEAAYRLERDVLGRAVGKQDHYASACGWLARYSFRDDNKAVKCYPYPESVCEFMMERTLLFYLGQPRNAGPRLQQLRANILNTKLYSTLAEMVGIAWKAAAEIWDKRADRIGYLLEEAWRLKCLYGNVTTTDIEYARSIAIKNGAYSAKITGAGGGGHLLVFAEPEKHNAIISALSKLAKHIPVKVSRGAWVQSD